MTREEEEAAIAAFLASQGATHLPSSKEIAEADPTRGLRWSRDNRGRLVLCDGEKRGARGAAARWRRKPPRKII